MVLVKLRQSLLYAEANKLQELVDEEAVQAFVQCIQTAESYVTKYEGLWWLISVASQDRFGPAIFNKAQIDAIAGYLNWSEDPADMWISIMALWVLADVAVSIEKDEVANFMDVNKIVTDFWTSFNDDVKKELNEEQQETIIWALGIFTKFITDYSIFKLLRKEFV